MAPAEPDLPCTHRHCHNRADLILTATTTNQLGHYSAALCDQHAPKAEARTRRTLPGAHITTERLTDKPPPQGQNQQPSIFDELTEGHNMP